MKLTSPVTGRLSLAGVLGSPCRVDRPLPLREPVSAAFTLATEFHHASAALWADQIDDRGDDARVQFAWRRFNSSHVWSPNCFSHSSCRGHSKLHLFQAISMRGAAEDRVRR